MKKVILLVFIIATTGLVLLIVPSNKKKSKIPESQIPDKEINYTIPDNYFEVYEQGIFYYLRKTDPEGKDFSISIDSYETDLEYSKEFLSKTELVLKEKYNYKVNSKKYYKTPYYDAAIFKVETENYNKVIYYILTGIKMVIVEGNSHGFDKGLEKDLKSIVDTIYIP